MRSRPDLAWSCIVSSLLIPIYVAEPLTLSNKNVVRHLKLRTPGVSPGSAHPSVTARQFSDREIRSLIDRFKSPLF
jgi:hypothetical protein